MDQRVKSIELQEFVRGVIHDIKSAVAEDKGFIRGGVNIEVLIDRVERTGKKMKVYVLKEKAVSKREISRIKFKIDFPPEGKPPTPADILNKIESEDNDRAKV